MRCYVSADMRVSLQFGDVRLILFAACLGRVRCVAGAYFKVQGSIFVGRCGLRTCVLSVGWSFLNVSDEM